MVFNKKLVEKTGWDGGGNPSKAIWHFFEYDDPKNNIYINFKFDKERIYTYKPEDEEKVLVLHILDGHYEKKKKRAPKGMTREIMCEFIKYIIDIKSNKINADSKIYVFPADLGVFANHNTEKLKDLYRKMGFKDVSTNDMYLGTPINVILKWCHDTYGTKKDIAKPKAKAKPKEKAKASGGGSAKQTGKKKIVGKVLKGENEGKVQCGRCGAIVKRAGFKAHTKTKKCQAQKEC